jgi:DNA-binding MarR family transcriptional regulator
MSDETPWYETIVLPALLRHARATYGAAMRRALAEAGYDDIPKNGMYVIGGLALGAGDAPLSVLIEELGVSKQAAGQLIDTLVLRGYLSRETNEEDRRRLIVTLTERGKEAARAQAEARAKIDAQLLAKMGRENISRTRKTLAALCGIGKAERAAH